MYSFKRVLVSLISVLLIFSVVGCDPVDEDYGVVSDVVTEQETENEKVINNADTAIMSLDRVMSNYFDISLFDEENYADVYLGKKFKLSAGYNDKELNVPCKLSDLEKAGWSLAEGNSYDSESLVFSYESVNLTLQDENGKLINAQLFNSSRSSKKLSKCYVVKFTIENNFYADPNNYDKFNINGITNEMAITDIVQILGTPSHFYSVSDNSYYLDYFITKKDRRNGITIYINPVDDLITKIEFSYYK